MASFGGGWTPGDITAEVANTVDVFVVDAKNWGNKAENALSRSEILEELPQDIGVAYAPATKPSGLAFQKVLPAPIKPDVEFEDPVKPVKITINRVQGFSIPNKPNPITSFSFDPGVSEPGPKPTVIWGDAPEVIVPELSEIPQIDEPTLPTLSDIDIPTFDGLGTLPTLSIDIPLPNFPVISGDIDYTSELFASVDLDLVLTHARAIVAGRMAVAQHIWDATWSRVAGDLSRQAVAIDRKARREHSKLGWSLPGNLARQAEATQEINEKISAKALEIGVQQALQNREDFWKAIETIENTVKILLEADNAHQERLLKTAIAVHEAEIGLLNASVATYNAIVQAAHIEAQAKEIELRLVLAPLEIFKAELEAAKLTIEIDDSRVKLYVAQWEAAKTRVQAYAAWIDGVKSYVDAQRVAVEAFGEEVKAKQTIIQAWATEWDAYTKKLEKPKLKIDAFQAQTALFGHQVQLYGSAVQGEKAKVDSAIDVEKLTLQKAGIEVQQYGSEWSGIEAKVRAKTGIYSTEGQVFSALTQAESARSEAQIKEFQADIDISRANLDASVETMKAKFSYWEAFQRTAGEWEKALANVYAQLASAAYSAANVSLGASQGYSSSWSNTYGKTLSRSYGVNVGIGFDDIELNQVDVEPPQI